MSALVNLILSFVMGLFYGHQIEKPITAQYEFQEDHTEIIHELKDRQQVLES